MIDFLKDVPEAAWAAIVTGVFLTGQNFLNNRRDDKRRTDDATERQAEREFQSKQTEQARADARRETWREERMNAHEALITHLRAAVAECRIHSVRFSAKNGEWIGRDEHWREGLLTTAQRDALDDAVARVEIVASEDCRRLAEEATDVLRQIEMKFWLLSLIYAANGDEDLGKRLEALAGVRSESTELRKAVNRYIAAARNDLGTTG